MQETQNAFIQHLIQNPQGIGRQDIPELERLSQAYPASNFLHILLAKSKQNEPGFDETLNKAAVYSANRKTLFYLIHQPEKLLGEIVEEIGIVREVEVVKEVLEDDKSEIGNQKSEIEEAGQVDFTDENVGDEVESVEEVLEDEKSEIINPESEVEKVGSVEEVVTEEKPVDKSEIGNLKSQISNPESEIDDEVFEEIQDSPYDQSEIVNRKSEIEESEITEQAVFADKNIEDEAVNEQLSAENTQAVFAGENNESEIEEVVEDPAFEETPQVVFTDENVEDEVEEQLSAENLQAVSTDGNVEAVKGAEEQPSAENPQAVFTDENVKGEEVGSVEDVSKEDKSEISKSEIDDEVFEEITETPFAYINRENDTHIPDGEAPQTAVETGVIDDEIFEEINEAPFTKSGVLNPKSEIKNSSHIPDVESPQTAAETGSINEETFEEIAETPFTKSESAKSEIVNSKSEIPPSEIPSLESFQINSVIPSLEELPAENSSVQTTEQSKNQPSRYHDEKMPYSFMWWLDKTRQEHAQTYQPYASPFRPDTSAQIETAPTAKEPLEQQYIEHIFHLRSVEELEQSTTQPQTVPFAVDKKETKIIEKFIREEPQISTPRPEKLDVENKARKSTEDKLDMVSETLAKIYTEQMLYHKAIDTYEKLRLKYPDKSGYFAARIDELEQKIR